MENNQYLLETQGYLYIVQWTSKNYGRMMFANQEKPMAKIFGNKKRAEEYACELSANKFNTSITTFKILKDGSKESITMELQGIGL